MTQSGQSDHKQVYILLMSLGTTFMPTHVAELGMGTVVENDNSTRVYL
jgi:hypothetical protein